MYTNKHIFILLFLKKGELIDQFIFIYRTAFSEFDAETVANLTDKQMVCISSEYGIDISRVRGVVDNANRILEVMFKNEDSETVHFIHSFF